MSGTVKMGKKEDPDACVDNNFRVRGVENLRVADMSCIPIIVKSVQNCPVAMLPILTKVQQPYANYGISDRHGSR
jgi:choline dehydrogenase-like flavoprotein